MHYRSPSACALLTLSLLSISGCSQPTKTIVQTEQLCPPAHLTEETPAPDPLQEGDPWMATIEHIAEWRAALRSANTDKKAMRKICE